MTGARPCASVCIPTYNRAAILRETVRSVLDQTLPDYEVVISDNASSDDTPEVVRAFADPRVRYHRNPRNVGAHENWKQVLRLARGRFIAPLTDDDRMLPENLAHKVAVLAAHPAVGLVHSKYHVLDGEGRRVRADTNWGHGPDRTRDEIQAGAEVLAQMLLSYNRINLPTVVFRRECYDRLGGFSDRLVLVDDWEYWMRIAAHYDIAFLARPLAEWRFHGGSHTSQYALDREGETTPAAFREELVAKRLILTRHLPAPLRTAAFRRRVWADLAARIVARTERLLPEGGPNPEARRFALTMCRAVPEALRHVAVWKVLLKTLLRPGSVARLKRVVGRAGLV
ncbi:MAG: glycosyltransferase [Candidatus Methylomirabilales bacterium]